MTESIRQTADSPGRWREVLRKLLQDKIAAISLALVLLYAGIAFAGEAYSVYCRIAKQQPFYSIGKIEDRFQPPSAKHLFGTDYMGRDVLSRAIAGTRTAVKIGVIASLLSVAIGVTLGALAGYFGSWIDDFVVWIYSTFAAMPTLLFILAFALLVNKGFLFPPAALAFKKISSLMNMDPGMMAVYLGIGLTGWVSLCRVVRAETLRLRETAYVQAAKSLGYRSFRIITRHVIPNLFHLVIIYFTMRFAFAIMTEVIVSYLGLGVQLEPSWGVMIADGQERLWRGVWWEVGAATIFMFFLVLPLNILGDALRDVLDPRLES
ncbi:MAG: hypothetical protein A2X49_05190 [Lentisphaerae bacterium GWF2_52_8]|nr:MAG: hypothetical protein A2X49_05190 [Lentisphaerae bacterium GWF2_52_8]